MKFVSNLRRTISLIHFGRPMLRCLALIAAAALSSNMALAAVPMAGEDEAGAPRAIAANVRLAMPSALVAELGCGETRLDRAPYAAADETCSSGIEDEAWLAANLLVGQLGDAAAGFASEHAAASAAEQDTATAELWTRISAIAAELTRRR
jgi:hypothetical protein